MGDILPWDSDIYLLGTWHILALGTPWWTTPRLSGASLPGQGGRGRAPAPGPGEGGWGEGLLRPVSPCVGVWRAGTSVGPSRPALRTALPHGSCIPANRRTRLPCPHRVPPAAARMQTSLLNHFPSCYVLFVILLVADERKTSSCVPCFTKPVNCLTRR